MSFLYLSLVVLYIMYSPGGEFNSYKSKPFSYVMADVKYFKLGGRILADVKYFKLGGRILADVKYF